MDRTGYRERTSSVPGAVVWTSAPAGVDTGPVLPDGCLDLLWRSDTERLLVAGPDTRPQSPDEPGEAGAGACWTGLRFAPGHAPAVLGVPADVLRDRRVDLADLWDAARVRRLTALVAASATPGTLLEAVAGTEPAREESLRHAVRALAAGRPVARVAADLDVSERTLHRRSLAAFGYSPQLLARVLRFRRALTVLRAGAAPVRVAADLGFTDQAHLTREVRRFAGTTPGALQLGSGANRSTAPPSGSSTVA
ncbi:helix-turn-helix domain-containing protein [Kineococcus sp. LSe6-4]|uniref:Helix-turn-helix domain-containing protein n=1 Tax=Kineococcus halophytocola TaxID=3234027 RepID=A0ABV4GYB0_9ACTN